MNHNVIETAQYLLNASLEEVESVLDALNDSAREEMVAAILDIRHKQMAAYHKARIDQGERISRIIPPVTKVKLFVKGHEATIYDHKGWVRKGERNTIFKLAQAMREIYGKDANTDGINSGDYYTVRSLVPTIQKKRRARICISATSARA